MFLGSHFSDSLVDRRLKHVRVNGFNFLADAFHPSKGIGPLGFAQSLGRIEQSFVLSRAEDDSSRFVIFGS